MLLLRRLRLLAAVLLSMFVAVPVLARGGSHGGSVYVHGYTRSNGTYVQPHYRSAPDGNFYNNWSTKGNVNPYTGREGTKVNPPSGYGGSSGDTGGAYQPGGYNPSDYGPWNNYGVVDLPLKGTAGAVQEAEKLRELGVTANAGEHTETELADWRQRVEAASRLKALGWTLDWQQNSLAQIESWITRVQLANEVNSFGYRVDPKEQSLQQLQQWRDGLRNGTIAGAGHELLSALLLAVRLTATTYHANLYSSPDNRIDGEIVNGTDQTLTRVTIRFAVREHGDLVAERRFTFQTNIPPGRSQIFQKQIELPTDVVRDLSYGSAGRYTSGFAVDGAQGYHAQ